MQALVSSPFPHVRQRFLEGMAETPIAVDWSQELRLAWPKTEVYVDGVLYQPHRPDPEVPLNSKNKRWLPADELLVGGAQLRELFTSGKIDVGAPFCDVGRVVDGDALAFRSWPESKGNLILPKETGPFDDVLIWAKLLKNAQVWPAIKIKPGEIFVAPYAVVREMTFGWSPSVEILRR